MHINAEKNIVIKKKISRLLIQEINKSRDKKIKRSADQNIYGSIDPKKSLY